MIPRKFPNVQFDPGRRQSHLGGASNFAHFVAVPFVPGIFVTIRGANIGSSLSSTCRGWNLQGSVDKCGDFNFECSANSQFAISHRAVVHVNRGGHGAPQSLKKFIRTYGLIYNTDINPATIRWNTSRVSALFFSDIFHEKIAHAYRIFFKEREREN